jgi:hypothetical protein
MDMLISDNDCARARALLFITGRPSFFLYAEVIIPACSTERNLSASESFLSQ